jgi:hypothetical protein
MGIYGTAATCYLPVCTLKKAEFLSTGSMCITMQPVRHSRNTYNVHQILRLLFTQSPSLRSWLQKWSVDEILVFFGLRNLMAKTEESAT